DATNGRAQGSMPLTAERQREIVEFEMALATAHAYDYGAGSLNSNGAAGGSSAIATQTTPSFFVGINDPLGGNPKGTAFTPVVFTLFNAWANQQANGRGGDDNDRQGARARIARGEALFNSKRINITGVAGLHDDLGVASIPGTC